MVKTLKVGDLVYQNIDVKIVDDEGNIIDNPNIPSEPQELKNALADTLSWIVGQSIVKTIGNANKKDTSTTKAVMLLAKVVNSMNPDISNLTTNEQNALQKMVDLADIGYTDSELLNATLDELKTQLEWYTTKTAELEALSTYDELVAFAESL